MVLVIQFCMTKKLALKAKLLSEVLLLKSSIYAKKTCKDSTAILRTITTRD